MKAIVSGLLNIETTAPVESFPISYCPIKFTFNGVTSNVSGVGCNIAKALTVLGDNVDLISLIGDDDDGERIIKDLKRSGIKTDLISAELNNTPTSVILYASDGKRQVYCDLKDIQEHYISPEKVMDKLRSADAAILCNINFNRELIKSAHKNGVLTATDVHVLSNIEDEYNRDFMENADILFLSDESLPCPPDIFIKQIYDRYHNRIIVIGMGPKGAMLLEDGNISVIPAYSSGTVINTVGAGDALFSAFMHFFVKGHNALDALKRAVIFAGLKIRFNGASVGFSEEAEIETIIKKQ